MRLLYLADRLSFRGGADNHLVQVIARSVGAGHQVTVAVGRIERGAALPDGVTCRKIAGLAARAASDRRLDVLRDLLADADVIHVQNVMNPVALEMAAVYSRVVVTVQDHRFFCPGSGRTLPDGSRCVRSMGDGACRDCLPDDRYRRSTLDLTRRRLAAVRGMNVVVLSRYMARELAAVGVPNAMVLPPWVAPGAARITAGATVLIGGRLVAHKGIADAAWAWRRAGRPLRLQVAGEGPAAAELSEAEHLGWLHAGELRRALRRARMLLFPARWQEPFGILGLEALAEGTPVVVVDCGGTREWSKDGCVRVEPGDVTAMAAAVVHLANWSDEALALGRLGQRAVEESFSEARLGPLMDALYRKMFAR